MERIILITCVLVFICCACHQERQLQEYEGANDLSLYYDELQSAINESPNGSRDQQLAKCLSILGQENAIDTFSYFHSLQKDQLPEAAKKGSAVSLNEVVSTIAENTSIVMINESHHRSINRVVTGSILSTLYQKGYRYLAAEGLTVDISEARPIYPNELTYPDPEYANMLRKALEMGFSLIAYDYHHEIEDSTQYTIGGTYYGFSFPNKRDLMQARNIIEKSIDADPKAKIVVHVGYGHHQKIPEQEAMEGFGNLYYFLKTLTGHTPFVIDQTSAVMMPSTAYKKILSPDFSDMYSPFCIETRSGQWYDLSVLHDASVFLPLETAKSKRPGWLKWQWAESIKVELTKPHQINSRQYLVYVWREEDGTKSIPIDLYMASGRTSVHYLPKGKYNIMYEDTQSKAKFMEQIRVRSDL